MVRPKEKKTHEGKKREMKKTNKQSNASSLLLFVRSPPFITLRFVLCSSPRPPIPLIIQPYPTLHEHLRITLPQRPPRIEGAPEIKHVPQELRQHQHGAHQRHACIPHEREAPGRPRVAITAAAAAPLALARAAAEGLSVVRGEVSMSATPSSTEPDRRR